jgi:hypothetical protein
MTMAILEPTKTHSETAKILDRAVCLMLQCRYLGNHRKIDVDDLVEVAGGSKLDVEAEQQLTATKKLVDSKELLPAMRVLRMAKKKLRKMAIPSHRVFGERSYLVPLAKVEEIDNELVALSDLLREEAAKLALRYAEAQEKQRAALGKLFREDDYLKPSAVAAAYAIEWNYVSFQSPEKLETVSSALAQASQKRYEKKLSDAFEEVRQTLRRTALRVTREFVEKLGQDKTGKPKAVRGSALDDLKAFVANYRDMNLTDDAELDGLVRDLRSLETGTSVDDLRDDESAREQALDRAAEIVQRLEVLVGSRGISFDETL